MSDQTTYGEWAAALPSFSEEPVTGPIGVPPLIAAKFPKEEGLCMWFLHCFNEATGTLFQPMLGDVPVCDGCHEKVENLR